MEGPHVLYAELVAEVAVLEIYTHPPPPPPPPVTVLVNLPTENMYGGTTKIKKNRKETLLSLIDSIKNFNDSLRHYWHGQSKAEEDPNGWLVKEIAAAEEWRDGEAAKADEPLPAST